MNRIIKLVSGAIAIVTIGAGAMSSNAYAASNTERVHAKATGTGTVVVDRARQTATCGADAIDLESHSGRLERANGGDGRYSMSLCYYNGEKDGRFVIAGSVKVTLPEGTFVASFDGPIRVAHDLSTRFKVKADAIGGTGAFAHRWAPLTVKGSFTGSGPVAHDAFTIDGRFRATTAA